LKKLVIVFSLAFFLLLGMNSGASASSNTYTVKSGDSLYRISKTYKISVKELKQWNNLKSDIIHPKQVLIVSKVKATTTPIKKESSKVVKVITVNASAYTVNCKGCTGITATGINLKKNPNQKVISVDPKVIKLGTKVYVEGYGYAVAADKGSAIKGNKIDVFMTSKKAAINWGRKTVKVKILR
jgi:3D (Asp-Asp-Asp) domain-containing protein